MREIFQKKRLSKNTLEVAEELLDGVLQKFDDYVNGEQYNVQIFSSPDMRDVINSYFVSGHINLCNCLEQELGTRQSA